MILSKEKQVCALEYAHELKALGVPQASAFYWQNFGQDKWDLAFNYSGSEGSLMMIDVAAHTVAELCEILPKDINIKGITYWLVIQKVVGGWRVDYSVENGSGCLVYYCDSILANALAKMLIYLIESGYVKVEDLLTRR